MEYACKLKFLSSDKKLEKGFVWAKEQALAYAHHGGDAVGLWYEAALPNRQAFCMRDVCHQSYGAAAMGLFEHTFNMLYCFAKNCSLEKDYCTYWEITKDNLPCKDDYDSDQDFWYNFPGSFEVIRVCYEQYLWTENREFLTNETFLQYYNDTCTKLVERWDIDQDGLLEHYAKYGRRGLASYNETDVAILTAGDMLASQYAAYRCFGKILAEIGKAEEAKKYKDKAIQLKKDYIEQWYNEEKKEFYGAIKADRSFYDGYYKEGNFLPLFYGILDGEEKLFDAVNQLKKQGAENVEGMSYLPQIYYEHGEAERGYEVLMELCDESLPRREYPEISFSVVGTITNQIMGIKAIGDKQIMTCSKLQKGDWAQMEYVSIFQGFVDVAHNAEGRESLTNRTGGDILWKAAFIGSKREAEVNGVRHLLNQEKDAASNAISYVLIPVKNGESAEVRVL